ncbi:MAG: FHA domain-containing protein [Kofleriaceae bacterium]
MPKPEKPAGGRAAAGGSEPDEASPRTPVRTKPLDETQRDAWFEGPDVVTALHVYEGDVEYQLPPKATLTLGASRSCDLAVPGRDLSAMHCLLERKGSRLRVYDQHSTNGTFFGGRRIDVIDVNPGDTFTPAPVTFLAMNEVMRTHRPTLVDILGANFAPSPDRVLVDAIKGSSNLLITGETGCDLDALARSIHAVSLRRLKDMVEISAVPAERAKQREIIAKAARSTLLINLDATKAALDPTFCSMVFSSEYHVRVIVLALTTNLARKWLPAENVEQMQHIWVRPLAMRPGDVPDLLDRMLAQRQASFRLADLSRPNREALCENEWRDNFVGLRLAADRLTAISRIEHWEAMDWRERSASVGVPKSTLHDWFVGVGLACPLFVV